MTEALPAVVERLEGIIAHGIASATAGCFFDVVCAVKQVDESVDDLQKLAESVQEHQHRIQDKIQKL